MARGVLAAVRVARFPCPASGRQLGHVRKSIDKKKWSARFMFKRQGDRVTLDGPARTLKADAEADRQFVAAAASQVSRGSRADVASSAMNNVRSGARTNPLAVSDEEPGSASFALAFVPEIMQKIKKTKLRSLAI